ncbi:MAG TPA: hypothetical protein VK477_06465 [Acidobacteriota bacterium]|nr:hypothetical protein [Acidobacteriota bacterium]
MKMMLPISWTRILLVAASTSALWLCGCATPETRIKANPEAFARLTPAQQALVKAGSVALGFDMEAVRLALGDPDRVITRTDAEGERQIWHYCTYEANGQVLFTGYYHTGRNWWGGGWAYPYYMNYPDRTVRDRFRIEFTTTGKVAAITQEMP